jgi:hypothetical protein
MENELKNLIGCFIAGITLDTAARLQSPHCAMFTSDTDLETIAKYYRTTASTICRWRKAGVNVSDPLSVALNVMSLQRADQGTVEAILDALHENTTDSISAAACGELQ